MSMNYNSQYIDVEKWVSGTGYVDYIMPQIYFGFNNSACPYNETVAKWNRIITNKSIKLYIGLAPYKIGVSDSYAGSGKDETELSGKHTSFLIVFTHNRYSICKSVM